MQKTNSRSTGLLANGHQLPLMEEFYSIQGEGFHTGEAAWFIRIGGCDVGCSWCDIKESWNSRLFPPVSTNEIVEHAIASGSPSVVVTGGEPLLYNLDYLCNKLKDNNIATFLETSGSAPLSGTWDWICLSPKGGSPPLDAFYPLASELKVIIQSENDLLWAEQQAQRISRHTIRFLQPEWSRSGTILPVIIRYIQEHPSWRLSLQVHKYIGIP